MSPFVATKSRLAALAISALLLTSCSGSTDNLFGEDLFSQTCAVCHGANGQGAAGRPALGPGSDAVNLSDEQIRGVIQVGPGAMPAFDRLSTSQIDSLVDWIRHLQAGTASDD